MVGVMAKRDLHNVLFPKQRKILTDFGEDLLLVMKRRGFTKKLLCERTSFIDIALRGGTAQHLPMAFTKP